MAVPGDREQHEVKCLRHVLVAILKEIGPEYSLEGLMLKLKLKYFGPLMQRADSLEKTMMLEKIRAGGERGGRG